MCSDLTSRRLVFEGALGVPFTDGNRVKVLRNGREIFPAMLEAIDAAETSIEFLTFVYWTGKIADRFADALARATRRGVEVRVLLDGFGATPMRRELIATMSDAGVLVEWFRRPVRWKIWQSDNRTHRKVLVCDGKFGFTGGVGIAEEWEGDARDPTQWRDTHFAIEGPAVHGLRAAFVGNWIETGQPIDQLMESTPATAKGEVPIQVIRGSAGIGWTDIATLMRLMILQARRRLRITSAYFAPDRATHDLLRAAVRRGVEVEVLVPGPHADKRLAQLAGEDQFESLLDAGVNLWSYQRTMLHAKVMTIDDQLACVGSANFNHRSVLKDDELSLVILHAELTAELDRHFDEDLESSERLEPRRWRRRGPLQRLKEAATRPFRRQT